MSFGRFLKKPPVPAPGPRQARFAPPILIDFPLQIGLNECAEEAPHHGPRVPALRPRSALPAAPGHARVAAEGPPRVVRQRRRRYPRPVRGPRLLREAGAARPPRLPPRHVRQAAALRLLRRYALVAQDREGHLRASALPRALRRPASRPRQHRRLRRQHLPALAGLFLQVLGSAARRASRGSGTWPSTAPRCAPAPRATRP